MQIRSISARSVRLAAAASTAVLFAACAGDSPTSAARAVGQSPVFSQAPAASVLGSAASFGVLAATTVTCTGSSTIAGDVGVWPGTAITGFNPTCTLTGTLHAGDAVARKAQADAAAAYASLLSAANYPCTFTYGAVQELDGLVLSPGVYCFPSSATLKVGGVLTLNGAGIYIFKVGSTFITFTNSQVNLTGNASCSDVYWLVGSSATLAGSVAGNIIAVASIGMDPYATLSGGAFALGGAVTMSGHNTEVPCGGGSLPPPPKQKCNQGVGNGPEGCDPGNSNNVNGSNDEKGGTPGNPGRKP